VAVAVTVKRQVLCQSSLLLLRLLLLLFLLLFLPLLHLLLHLVLHLVLLLVLLLLALLRLLLLFLVLLLLVLILLFPPTWSDRRRKEGWASVMSLALLFVWYVGAWENGQETLQISVLRKLKKKNKMWRSSHVRMHVIFVSTSAP